MKFLGWTIERSRGARVGSLQDAIEDVQARLAKIENVLVNERRKVIHEEDQQAEIQKILAAGDGATAVLADDLLWGTE